MDPSPLQVSEIRLRLRNLGNRIGTWESTQETVEKTKEIYAIMEEINALGQDARLLAPDLLAAIKQGKFYAPRLYSIIARLKDSALLAAALESVEKLTGLSPTLEEKCVLLKAGFFQFQCELLDELFRVFEVDIPTDSQRAWIVEALAQSGTSAALETLRVIEYRTAGRIPELEAELAEDAKLPEPEELAPEEMVRAIFSSAAAKQLERHEWAPERRKFLEQVRDAIKQIGSRPDPEPVVSRATPPASILGFPVAELVKQRESGQIELKSTLRWDLKEDRFNEDLEHAVVKTIAAFGNSQGGTLVIGVGDDGTYLGLGKDYASLRGDRDKFERHIRQLLQRDFGSCWTALNVHFDFPLVHGVELCQINVTLATEPLFVTHKGKGCFYIRNGNKTDLLEADELVKYCRAHFGK